MTIKQLITELQKHPENTLVLVDGYEDGYDNPKELKKIYVTGPKIMGKCWWNGKYSDDYNNSKDNKLAIIIPR